MKNMTAVTTIKCLGLALLFLDTYTVAFRSLFHGERLMRRNILLRMSSGDESTHFDYLVVGGGSGGSLIFFVL